MGVKRMRWGWLTALLVGLMLQGLWAQGVAPHSQVLQRCLAEIRAAAKQHIVTGFLVQVAGSQQVLAQHEADQLLVPASNMKLLTVGATLLALGAEHVIDTDLIAHGKISSGRLAGSLRLRGEGDPTLQSQGSEAAPARLAHLLRAAGVARIEGDLLVDDRLFSDSRTGPDWPLERPTARWVAEVSALSLDRGTILLQVLAGKQLGLRGVIGIQPKVAGVVIQNRTRTVAAGKPTGVQARRAEGPRLIIKGSVRLGASQSFQVAVRDPALVFGRVLAQALAAAGVQLKGRVRRPAALESRTGGVLVARLKTTVAQLIPTLLKESQNHYADMLFKHLGSARAQAGSFAGGARAVRETFAHQGLPLKGVIIRDGSGLSRSNRVTARALASVLQLLWKSPSRQVFLDSLAQAGEKRGTLRRRLVDLGRRVKAKTGTLNHVSALSGYVQTARGKTLVFSILTNGGALTPMRKLQDRLVRLLAGLDGA